MRPDSGTGRGFSRTEFTIVKIAVLAPMQTASVIIAVAAYPRSFHRSFKPSRTSRNTIHLLGIQPLYGKKVTDVPIFLGAETAGFSRRRLKPGASGDWPFVRGLENSPP